MYTSLLFGTLRIVYLQLHLMIQTFASPPNFDQLLSKSDITHWPLKAGYPGLKIENLNEYVSLFSHCLVNIQNYQGIEIVGIQSPVYITRFDAALLDYCHQSNDSYPRQEIHRFIFGATLPKTKQNCSTPEYQQIRRDKAADDLFQYLGVYVDNLVKYTDASFTRGWTCTAQFDLFFPEPEDAPHIVINALESNERNLLDISPQHTITNVRHREAFGKLL